MKQWEDEYVKQTVEEDKGKKLKMSNTPVEEDKGKKLKMSNKPVEEEEPRPMAFAT